MSLTPDQEIMRRGFVGASEVPCLLKVSPFGNPISVWCSKMNIDIRETTDAMDLGNFLEPGIARMYQHKSGRTVIPWTSVVHPKHSFMGCTPDLICFGERRIVQIKLVGAWMATHWSDDAVPEYVMAQIQQELEVCDADVCDVVAVIGGTDYRVYTIERDRELGGYLVEVCRKFWTDHVLTREMPPVDASPQAEAALRALYARGKRPLIEATEESDRAARAYLTAHQAEGKAKEEKTLAGNQLRSLLGDHEGIEGDSYRVRWSAPNEKGTRTFTCKEIQIKKARIAA